MRIISGKYRGRRLQPRANLPVRPTTDFAKEGLFNVLNNQVDFESLRVLDLFTGTGSIAFEFLSRGVVEVTAVDSNYRCIEFVRKTAETFGADNLKCVKTNVFVFLRQMKTEYDLVFADPPYDLSAVETIPDIVFAGSILAAGGMLILEHSADHDFSKHPFFTGQRNYGSVHFSFFGHEGKEGS